MAYKQKLDEDPNFFLAERQADLKLNELRQLFLSDNKEDVMPVL